MCREKRRRRTRGQRGDYRVDEKRPGVHRTKIYEGKKKPDRVRIELRENEKIENKKNEERGDARGVCRERRGRPR